MNNIWFLMVNKYTFSPKLHKIYCLKLNESYNNTLLTSEEYMKLIQESSKSQPIINTVHYEAHCGEIPQFSHKYVIDKTITSRKILSDTLIANTFTRPLLVK